MKDQSCVPRARAPSSTVNRSTREDNIIMFNQNFVYANTDSDLSAIIIISYK